MFGSSEMIIVLVIVLVLFGGSQLPKLAKNLGKAQKEFKDGIAEADQAEKDKPASDAASTKTDAAESNDAPPSS
ncbi:MAG: twin-arginine translocase TatA/TatE family subunit [Ilumatobacteraceae bacterium]|nr:twin-arginine translocase TatA/TatE family subunit [Ilumatobacteraceae bacterium]